MPPIQGFEAAEGILMDMYGGFINQIKKDTPPLWARLKPSTDKVEGQQVKFSAQVENPQGLGSRKTYSSALPAAVPGKYMELAVGTGRMYGVLEFDAKLLKAAGGSGKKAFVNYAENEFKGLKTSFLDDLGRQLFGDGSGVISVCGTTSASLTVQLATTANMEHFIEGMHIDLVVAATGVAIANGSDRTIESVDVDNLRIVLDTAGGVVTTDATTGVCRQGSWDAELTGLSAVVSATEDIYGVTTANQRRWQSYVKTSFGAFNIKGVGKVMAAAKIRSGAYCDIIVCHPDILAQYWYELTGTRTFDVSNAPVPVQKLGVGYVALDITIEGKKAVLMSDPNCPHGTIYGLNTEYLGIQHLGDPEFMNIGGTILLPNIYGTGGTATFKCVMEYYPELICHRRNVQWKITGVTDISGW